MVFFSVGCNPECVDKFDCASKITADKADWTCKAGKCVEGDPGGWACTEANQHAPDGGDGQCAADQWCSADHECVDCLEDAHCGTGFTCVDNACEPTGTGGGAGGGTGGGAMGGGAGGGAMGGGAGGGGGGMDAGTNPLVTTYYANLTGDAEVPPVTTSESGTATVDVTQLADGGYSADVTMTHTIAQGQLTAGHIHNSIAGRTGSPIVTLGTTGMALASPFSGAFDLTEAQAQEMKAGRTYINIHTNANAGGEIRGQLLEQGKGVAWAILNLPDGGPTTPGSGWQVIYDDPMDGGGPEIGTTVNYEGTWTETAAGARVVENLADGGQVTWLDMTANLTGSGTGVAGSHVLTATTQAGMTVQVEEADGGVLLSGDIN